MQANVIHSIILSAESEGNSRACTANAMGAENAPGNAPSATGIVVHVGYLWDGHTC